MIDVIKEYPEMIKQSMNLSEKLDLPRYEFNNVVICGAGGSAIVGDLLKDLLKYDYGKPIEVFVDYKLPKIVNEKTLTIFISYSGNTEEPLSQFMEALSIKSKIIGVGCGGKLEEWCKKLNLPFIKVPKGLTPRHSVPYLLVPLVTYMEKLYGGEFKKDLEESIEVLKKINTDELDKIASKIVDCDIAVYGPSDYSAVVRRFKNDFNENSKILVVFNTFPEFDHNDIEGYEIADLNKNRAVLILRDIDESFEMKNRIEITKDIIKGTVKAIIDIWSSGKSKLAKIFSFLFISGYLSCKLAELKKIDPEKTEFLDRLKKELEEKFNLVERLENRINSLT